MRSQGYHARLFPSPDTFLSSFSLSFFPPLPSLSSIPSLPFFYSLPFVSSLPFSPFRLFPPLLHSSPFLPIRWTLLFHYPFILFTTHSLSPLLLFTPHSSHPLVTPSLCSPLLAFLLLGSHLLHSFPSSLLYSFLSLLSPAQSIHFFPFLPSLPYTFPPVLSPPHPSPPPPLSPSTPRKGDLAAVVG